jgi:hypothetical protein
MKNHEIKFRLTIFTALLALTVFTCETQTASSQNEPTENKRSKYELSIDLVPIIDKGQFGKVYFKLNHYKEALLKGAYRFGVSKGTYMLWDNDLSTLPENVSISSDKHSHFETRLFLGYEKYKQIGPVLTYYGLDVTGGYYRDHTTPQNYTDDQKIISIGLCPFWGIKHFIYRNSVSVAFEVGWENSLSKNTNQYDGQVFYFTLSELQLPYNFTINYHF